MPVLMRVAAIAVEPSSNTPVVILRDAEGRFAIPIWIGVLEASAIHLHIEKVTLPRPMTHDLAKTIIERLGATLSSVLVSDIHDNTFFAELTVTRDDATFVIDARPSDALALALRFGAPIFVAEKVIQQAHREELRARLDKMESEGSASPEAVPSPAPTSPPGPVAAESGASSDDTPESRIKKILDLLESGAEPKWKA